MQLYNHKLNCNLKFISFIILIPIVDSCLAAFKSLNGINWFAGTWSQCAFECFELRLSACGFLGKSQRPSVLTLYEMRIFMSRTHLTESTCLKVSHKYSTQMEAQTWVCGVSHTFSLSTYFGEFWVGGPLVKCWVIHMGSDISEIRIPFVIIAKSYCTASVFWENNRLFSHVGICNVCLAGHSPL